MELFKCINAKIHNLIKKKIHNFFMHSFIKKINYVKYNDLFKTIQFLFEILFNIIKKKKYLRR